MQEYGVNEVRQFAAEMKNRMDSCDNGEGLECATLDGTLKNYATLCCEFRDKVREWGKEVFAGHVAFDPEVERILYCEGWEIFARARQLAQEARDAELPCYELDAQVVLESVLWHLHLLLDNWVTPRLAVGPGARQGLSFDEEKRAETSRRVEALKPLPRDWRPSDRKLRARFEKFRDHLKS